MSMRLLPRGWEILSGEDRWISSIDLASTMNFTHSYVLKVYRRIVASVPKLAAEFYECEYRDKSGRWRPMVRMTAHGMTMLVMDTGRNRSNRWREWAVGQIAKMRDESFEPETIENSRG